MQLRGHFFGNRFKLEQEQQSQNASEGTTGVNVENHSKRLKRQSQQEHRNSHAITIQQQDRLHLTFINRAFHAWEAVSAAMYKHYHGDEEMNDVLEQVCRTGVQEEQVACGSGWAAGGAQRVGQIIHEDTAHYVGLMQDQVPWEAKHVRAITFTREDAEKTIQHVIRGSSVTFSSGLTIARIIPGFELSTVRVKNLPSNTGEDGVRKIIAQQGVDPRHFQIMGMRRARKDVVEAEIVADQESARALVLGLEATHSENNDLDVEMPSCNSPGSMWTTTVRDHYALTVSWPAPSIRHIGECPDTIPATRNVNGQICTSRRIQVEHLCRSYDLDRAKQLLRNYINRVVTPGALMAFDQILEGNNNNNNTNTISIRVQFTSWKAAHKAHLHLDEKKFPFADNHVLRTWIRHPICYSTTIPSEQYQVQNTRWTALLGDFKEGNSCMLSVHPLGQKMRIRVSGATEREVGTLKLRVENLITGETINGWHRSLGRMSSRSVFVRSVFLETGAYIRVDARRQVLTVYGSSGAVEHARELVKSKLQRLSFVRYSIVLKKRSVDYFIQYGVPILKETFGEENITFSASSQRITVTGGNELRHALLGLIEESLKERHTLCDESPPTCPVCYHTVSSPVQLHCGHVYCYACMHHLLTSATSLKEFPLLCIGDESQCRMPIPIPTIQRFLPLTLFTRLVEASYLSYVSNSREFKYCMTPDCVQIYRVAQDNAGVSHECPSCFLKICTTCHEEEHPGTCQEFRINRRRSEQERLTEQWITLQNGSVRKCPECRVPIEKWIGCDHLLCKCGAEFCWRCLGRWTLTHRCG